MENVEKTLETAAAKIAALDKLFDAWVQFIKETTNKRSVYPADLYAWVRKNNPNEKEIHSDLRLLWRRKVSEGLLTKHTDRAYLINI